MLPQRSSFQIERFNFEKGETRRRRHSAARPKVSGKTAFFPRNDRPYGLKCEAFQTENALKARWGRDGGPGGKDYKNAFPSERLGLSRQQRPNGGRRPCPLRRRKLRASTAEMRGFPSPQKNDLGSFPLKTKYPPKTERGRKRSFLFRPRSILPGRA